jgi:adenylate cyclase
MERKLTAILCADVFGYSRLMGEDEEATLRTLSSHRKIIDSLIEQHHGRFVNSAGDSVLAEFASVVNAVQCAVEVQSRLATENENAPTARRMEFRIGVNLGDVMVEGEQIYGDGVNVAARLESLAEPGGICISNTVHDQVRNKLALNFEDLGEQLVKNIAEPIRVFHVLPNGTASTLRAKPLLTRNRWRSGVFSLAGLAIIVGTIVLVQHLSLKAPHTHASIPPQEKPALPLPSIPSIAVLPFTNQSGDPKQEYFSDGISDQLINDLSRVPNLFVIARNSSFAYKGKSSNEQEIGKQLGVKYVLEGSVRKDADQVRIGVELVDATSGSEAWTARYDRPLKDIFAVQDEIVGRVVTTLALLLKLDAMKAPHWGNIRSTENLEANDDFLRASEYFWRTTKDDNVRARLWLQKAIALDPNFSAAYSLFGLTYCFDVFSQWSQNPLADLKRAEELAQKALALDDSNSDALAVLSNIDWLERRPDQAVANAQRAITLNPNYAAGYQALSVAEVTEVKPDEVLHAAEQAIRLDPAARDYYGNLIGLAYIEMGRYQDAIPFFKRAIAVSPNLMGAHLGLIVADGELGRGEDARAEAAEVTRISPKAVNVPPEKELFKDAAFNRRVFNDFRKAGLK